jgi:hypothetical protein
MSGRAIEAGMGVTILTQSEDKRGVSTGTLIIQRKFASLQPFINELKKNQYSGQQASLF